MILKVNNLSFSYTEKPVLQTFSFSIGKGDCIAILGTNGVGKSTLLKCLNRILKPTAGAITINETNINDMASNNLAQEIGYVSQTNQFSDVSVFDAILLGRKPYIKWDVTKNDLEIVQDILKRMELSEYALRPVTQLSGGEMQKVAIARALAQQPNVLLFDEPTSNLDLKNQLEVIQLIKEIVEEQGISAMVTMHDLNLALRFANKFIMMKDGKLFAVGGQEIITEESIKEVYGVSVALIDHNKTPVVVPNA